MNVLLSNAFYDTSSPWYYVIGVVFLVLIFGALTAYILLSKKLGKNKESAEKEIETSDSDAAPENASADSAAEASGEQSESVTDDSGENQ